MNAWHLVFPSFLATAALLAAGEDLSPAGRFIDQGSNNRMDGNTITGAAAYQWGDETRGIKLGIRIEKKGESGQNLFSFTAAVLNVSTNAVTLPLGDSWHPPACPTYVFQNGERCLWEVAPPAVEHVGPGISHIAVPIGFALAPGELKMIHSAWFVPPLEAGEWTVSAQFKPKEASKEREKKNDTWRGPALSSRGVPLTILKTAEGPLLVRETLR